MATKTISIELDVYDRLSSLKKTTRESFSQVLRRGKWDSEVSTGGSILDFYKKKIASKHLIKEEDLTKLEDMQTSDLPAKDKWLSS